MEQEDNSLDAGYEASSPESTLESGGVVEPQIHDEGIDQHGKHLTLRYNRTAMIFSGIALSVIVLIGVGSLILAQLSSKDNQKSALTGQSTSADYGVSNLKLSGLTPAGQLQVSKSDYLVVNGQLQANETIVLTPSVAPATPTAGQIYYNQADNQPYYYNGTSFVSLAPSTTPTVSSLGGTSGAIGIGNGLQVTNSQLSVSAALLQQVAAGVGNGQGVSSLQGITGAVTLNAGTGIGITGTTIINTGITSLTAGSGISVNGNTITNAGVTTFTSISGNLVVANDGNGNYTIQDTSAGGGGVGELDGLAGILTLSNSTGVGTTVTIDDASTVAKGIAEFNGTNFTVVGGIVNTTQDIDTGASPTFNGLTLGQGSTGNLNFGNASNSNITTLEAMASGTQDQTITIPASTAGTDTFCLETLNNCAAVPGVTSLDLLSGALTLANSTGVGTTVTINDATTAAKGIAEFNATNFTVVGGIVNTKQNIGTSASPTFNGLTLSNELTVPNGGTGTNNLTSNGILYGNGTGTIQATAAADDSILATDGVDLPALTQTLPTAVQGNITQTGALTSGTIGGAFGDISTGNDITTTSTVQGGTVNATGTLELNGTDINTSGTLSNVAYLNQDNTFTAAGTALTVNNNATVEGALQVNGAATLGVPNTSNGSLVLDNSGDGHSTTLQGLASASQDQTITIPASTATTDTFCLVTLNNCFGSGGSGAYIQNGTAIQSNANYYIQGVSDSVSTVVKGAGGISNPDIADYISSAGAEVASINYQGGVMSAGLNNSNDNITNAGSLSGVTTISMSGAITGATSGNTINDLVINSGALSLVTGYSQTSGTAAITSANVAGPIFSVSDNNLTTNNSNLEQLSFTNANPSVTATTINGISIMPSGTASGANTLNSINLPNVTTVSGNTFNALNLGTGYDSLLNYNNTSLINGSGNLTNAAFGSAINYSNLNEVGALTSGSIASGFGTISTGNNIITTAGIQGGTLTITGGDFTVDSSGNVVSAGNLTVQGSSGETLGAVGTIAGSLTIENTANSNSTTLEALSSGSQSQIITIPASTVTTDTVCLETLGNCTSPAGIAGSGTTDYVARFTSSNAIGDGLLYDNGSGVSVDNAAPVGLFNVGTTSQFQVAGSGAITGVGLNNTSGGITNTGSIAGATSIGASGNITTTAAVQSGSLNVASGDYTVDGSGNIVTSGTLAVTGITTLGDAGVTNGSLALDNSSNTNTTTIVGIASGSQSQTITIPASTATTDTVCLLTLANCVGTGGGVSTTAGTQNYVTEYNNGAGTQITDSEIYDDSGVSIGNTSPVGLFNVGTTSQFQVASNGAVTAVGVNAGSGSLQGTGGLLITGAANISGGINNNSGGITNTGSIAGATTIGATGNITTSGVSATIQGDIINATGGTEALELGGQDINTAGILSNVAYLNQDDTFTGTGTALTVSNNAAIDGTLAVQGSGGITVGVAGPSGTAGEIVFNNASNAHITTLQALSSGTQDQTVTIPASSATTDTVCLLTLANCAGTGSGVSTTGGTQYYITEYNNLGASQITSSEIYDDSGVSIGNTSPVGLFNVGTTSQFQVASNGAVNSAGINNTNDGITNTGSISGVTTINATGNIVTTATVQGGALTITGGNFTVDSSGDVVSAGTLDVEGSGGITVGATGVAGSIIFDNTSNTHTTTLQGLASASQDQTITIPVSSSTADTVCLEVLNNCSGGGGGGVSGSGTSGQVAVFTGASAIGDSNIYESGGNISIGDATAAALFNVGASNQFQVATTGAITAVGVNAGSGSLQGTGGLLITGAANISGGINNNSGGITGTGSLAGVSTINATGNIVTTAAMQGGTLSIASGDLTVDSSGDLSTSGSLTVQGSSTFGVVGTTAGSLVLYNASNSHTTTLQGLAAVGQNQTITIPASSATTDTVCLETLGNCFGASGGATTTGGNQYYVPVYNTSSQITDSQIYANGTGVSVGGTGPSQLFNVGNTNQFNVSSTGAVKSVGINSGTGLIQGTGGLTVQGNTALTGSSTTAFSVGSGNTNSSNIINVDTTGNASNLITNGSFETNTTGWAADGTGGPAISQSGTEALDGLGSMKVVTSATIGNGAKYNLTLTNSTQYTLDIAVYSASTISANTLAIGYSDTGNTAGEADYLADAPAITAGSWTHIYYTFTPASHSGTPYIYIKQLDAPGGGRTFYVDGVVAEASTVTNQPQYSEGNIQLFGNITSPLDVQPVTNNTNAFDVGNSAGQELLGVDTVNDQVLVGTTSGTGELTAVSSSNTNSAAEFLESGTADGADINLTNTTAANDNGLEINHNGAGGTASNLIDLVNTAGTATNGIYLSGTFTNLINTASGAFTVNNAGTLTTTGNITASGGTATVQGVIVNASGGSADLQVNGTSINQAGTLSNVAYLNQSNTFTAAGTALTVNNNGLVKGSLTIQSGSGSGLILGQSGPAGTNGYIYFDNSTNANQTSITSLATTALALSIPADSSNSTDNICLATLNNCFGSGGSSGYIQNQSASTQSANYNIQGLSGTVTAVIQGAAGGSNPDITDFKASGGSTVASISYTGALTVVGVNSGSGLIQGSGGATITGALLLNHTGTANTSIGNSSGTFALTSSGGLNVDTTGDLTGVGSISASGTITAATASTINGLGINSGALTATGYTQSTGTGTISVTSTSSTGPVLSISDVNLSTNNSNLGQLNFTNNNSSGTETVNGLSITPVGTATSGGNILNSINLPNVTTVASNKFYALNVGTGYDGILGYTDNAADVIINGTGQLQNFAIGNTTNYSNLDELGSAITSGTITSFGAISTGNTIQGTNITATGGFFIGANNINTAGTLNNVAYLNQANTFTNGNIISPTTGSEVGLTVNATTNSTSAVAAVFTQANIGGSATPGDTVQINSTNTSGIQGNGLSINRNGSGGTTTNLLNLINTSGTATNGITLTATSNIATGIYFNGSAANFGTDLINTSTGNFSVTGAGSVTAVGVNSGAGLLQGVGGLSITGASTFSYTGTTGNGIGLTANSLTSGNGLSISSNSILQSGNGSLLNASLNNSANAFTTNGGTDTASVANVSRSLTANIAGTTGSAVALNTSATYTTTVTGITAAHNISYTVSANTNRYLLVSVVEYNDNVPTFTYNSVSVPLIETVANTACGSTLGNGTEDCTELVYGLKNPTNGVHNLTITPVGGGTQFFDVVISDWYNVNQTTPVGVISYSTGSSGNPTIGANSLSGETVVDAFSEWSNAVAGTPAPTTGQTLVNRLNDNSNGMGEVGQSYKLATGSPTSMSWSSVDGQPWEYATIPLNSTISYASESVTSPVASISNNCTNTAGICNDTSNVLSVNQQYANATGTVLNVQNAGTGDLLDLTNSGDSTTVEKVAYTGATTLQNTVNSASAFTVNNASGVNDFNIDTQGNVVSILQNVEMSASDNSGDPDIVLSDNISSPTESLRLRVNQSGANFEAGGIDTYMSGWSNANFTGTQNYYLRGVVGDGDLWVGDAESDGTSNPISGSNGVAALILDSSASATTGDPATAFNGMMYYNQNKQEFRCYQNGEWLNCVSSVQTYNTNDESISGSTSSTSWTDYPGSSSLTFTKLATNTKILVTVQTSWYETAASVAAFLGLQVDGNDYQCARMYFNTLSEHESISCSMLFSGSQVPAGTTTIHMIWSVNTNTTVLHADVNDFLSMTAQETD